MQYGGHHPQVVVLDNGGGTIKLGFEGESNPRLVFPNCTAKAKGERQVYVGQQLLEARELGSMVVRRPIDRGFLVNLDLQKDIWQKGFNALAASAAPGGAAGAAAAAASARSKAVLEYGHYSLVMTEPLFNFESVRAATEEIVFEEFGFNSFLEAPASYFSLQYACTLPSLVAELQPPDSLLPPQALPLSAVTLPGQPASLYGGLSPAAAAAAASAKAAGAGVVIDAGFSACYVVPFYDGQLLTQGVKRLNLGGKALTNLLKETVSYRSLDMRDEGLLMEQLKEQLCWVSQDVSADLRVANPTVRSPHRREVVLPDGVHNLRGYVKPPSNDLVAAFKEGGKFGHLKSGPWPVKPQHLQELAAKEQEGSDKPSAAETQAQKQRQQQAAGRQSAGGGPAVVEQVLQLNNELFMTPEALFRPSDIGLNQAGLPECVVQAVAACPAGLAPLLYAQVVLTGGCINVPGFVPRFQSELRALVPSELELVVTAPVDPDLTAWRGASMFAAGDGLWQCVKTRKQYNEAGAGRRER